MDPQTHDSGFIRGNGNIFFSDQAGEQGGSRAGFTDNLHITSNIILGIGVMVIDMYLYIIPVNQFSKFTDAVLLPGVYEDQPLDPVKFDLFHLGEVEEV